MKNCEEKYFALLNAFKKLLCDLESAMEECEKAYLQILSDKLVHDLLKKNDTN